jgi:hypothetical protein
VTIAVATTSLSVGFYLLSTSVTCLLHVCMFEKESESKSESRFRFRDEYEPRRYLSLAVISWICLACMVSLRYRFRAATFLPCLPIARSSPRGAIGSFCLSMCQARRRTHHTSHCQLSQCRAGGFCLSILPFTVVAVVLTRALPVLAGSLVLVVEAWVS